MEECYKMIHGYYDKQMILNVEINLDYVDIA